MTATKLPSDLRLRRRRDLSQRRYVLTSMLFFLLLAALFYSVYGMTPQIRLVPGQPSPQTYTAPEVLSVTDEVATAGVRQAAREQISPLYIAEPELRRVVLEALARAALPERVEAYVRAAYRRAQGVSGEQLPILIAEATRLAPPERQAQVRERLTATLLASAKPDPAATEAARSAAAQSITPVRRTLSAGEVIIREGALVTESTLEALASAGLYNLRGERLEQGLKLWLSCFLLSLLLSVPLVYFFVMLRSTATVGQLSFLVTLWGVTLLVQRVAFAVDIHLVFISFLPLLGAVLLGERLAFVLAVWLAAILAFLVPGSGFITMLTALSSSVVALLLAKVIRNRASLLIAALAGSLTATLLLALYTLLSGTFDPFTLLVASAWVMGGGLLAGILALATLPVAESSLGFLTEFKLLELMSPSNPLLQKLLLEAPGTYQHSVIIANLVEQAVSNIGGNALLARVAALYHDVGKLKRPQFFTENQFASDNPHDHISPHLSYLIITSHVRDGVEMLREYGLPKALEPFVNEHHGTTILAYFYKRALEASGSVIDLNFRYPGPRPQSKETAVLLLADAVESASRTLTEPTQGSIRAMIDRLFEQRLQDDQLAESPLNFYDLEVIASTFERMLTAILHRRVQYPSAEEIERLKRDRDTRRSQALSLP